MFLKKCINILNELLEDIIWYIYDELYKDIINIKLNGKQNMIFYIIKIKTCLERIYKSNIYINVNLKFIIRDIIKDIEIIFFIFKKELIQIVEIEDIKKFNLYYFNYLYYTSLKYENNKME